jgi:hypothetical protein
MQLPGHAAIALDHFMHLVLGKGQVGQVGALVVQYAERANSGLDRRMEAESVHNSYYFGSY